MGKILCFGELLLRFSPQLQGAWIRQNTMPVFTGGAELNVATALANWKEDVSYCTAMPDNYLSKEIITSVHHKKIQTDKIIFSGNRIGIYYLPEEADLKHASVIYDRANSSFSDMNPGQINWDEILEGVSWFHFSAISPALNEKVALVCKEALEAAIKKTGLIISVDLNYRSKLWQYGKQPHEVMPDLVQYCDIVMGNIWAKEKMLGIGISGNIEKTRDAFLEQSLKSSSELIVRFPKCKQVANTFRFDVGRGVKYYASLFAENQLFYSKEYYTDYIIDKVGSGDAFMAALIYGNRHQLKLQEIINFAVAAAFNKLFIKGDASNASLEDIKKHEIKYA